MTRAKAGRQGATPCGSMSEVCLAAAGGAGHRRIAEMSLIEARLRSTLASGCDDAARPARRRLETSCGVHHRGDRSRTPMDSSTRPSMLSSPPPIPSEARPHARWAPTRYPQNTVATRLGDLGVLPHVVEAILNHVGGFRSGVAGVYNLARYEAEMRDALTRWADYVEGLSISEARISQTNPT